MTVPSIQPLFLTDFDAEKSVVGMLVTPTPVLLLLMGTYAVPLAVLDVPLLYILAVGLIFVVVPPVIIFMLSIVIPLAVIVFGLHHKRHEYRPHQQCAYIVFHLVVTPDINQCTGNTVANYRTSRS
jgi:fumarate reductase subunit D